MKHRQFLAILLSFTVIFSTIPQESMASDKKVIVKEDTTVGGYINILGNFLLVTGTLVTVSAKK